MPGPRTNVTQVVHSHRGFLETYSQSQVHSQVKKSFFGYSPACFRVTSCVITVFLLENLRSNFTVSLQVEVLSSSFAKDCYLGVKPSSR
jgi:hypothetical protein